MIKRAHTRNHAVSWLVLALVAAPLAATADPARVVGAEAAREPGGTWRIAATVAHPDEGWDHYADAWRVEAETGEVLGERPLAHPHVDEQPFTRALGGVRLPDGTTAIILRARDTQDGWGEETFRLALPPG